MRDVALMCVMQGGFLFGFNLADMPLICGIVAALSATSTVIGIMVYMCNDQIDN